MLAEQVLYHLSHSASPKMDFEEGSHGRNSGFQKKAYEEAQHIRAILVAVELEYTQTTSLGLEPHVCFHQGLRLSLGMSHAYRRSNSKTQYAG
jgi:hypothetical protein